MLPVTSPHPQLSGFAIPQVWSARINEKFYRRTVLEEITNNDYEGDIKNVGDIVKIRVRPDITIRDYSKGQTLTNEAPNYSTIDLQINKGKYFSVHIDDVDALQSDFNLFQDFTDGASANLVTAINADVLSGVGTDFHADNVGANAGATSSSFDLGAAGAPKVLTASNVIETMAECAAVLSEQDVPEDNRWFVIPPWVKVLIHSSSLRNALVESGDQRLLRKGMIGQIAGFNVYESNQLVTATEGANTAFNMLFGHKSSITFASQLNHARVKEPESKFGTYAQGLNVYGYEVKNPEAGGVLYARKG